MRIGLDGQPLAIPFPCGSKAYAKNLISNLAKIDKKNSYYIFCKAKVSIPKQKNFHLVLIPNVFPVFKRQLIFPLLARKKKLDVFHFLGPYGIILRIHPKIVTTVHDYNLNYTYPFNQFPFKRLNTEVFRFFTNRNSKFFITPSNAIRKELNRSIKKSSVQTILDAASGDFKVISSSKNCVLAMGDFAPRKNILRVIKAYNYLPDHLKSKYNLKIVASTGFAKERFEEMTRKFGLQKYVGVLENVPTQKLVALYNKSLCFLYPSLYEGFGIPILEAMACGCPVITSNRGATKEVAGDAAYLVNPSSPREISKALKRIISDNKLYRKLRQRGLKRVKQFSWENAAKKTLGVYEKVSNLF
jgi:glycosyltransferase involved in cell wall biosynthesis